MNERFTRPCAATTTSRSRTSLHRQVRGDVPVSSTSPGCRTSNPTPYSRASGILHMQRFGIRSVVEVARTRQLWRAHPLAKAPATWASTAPTAVAKAKANFPHLDFRVDEVKNLAAYKDLSLMLSSSRR